MRKGESVPSSEVLIALSKALGVKVSFFCSSRVEIAGLNFRKKASLSVKEKDPITCQAIDFLKKYIEIEQILNTPILPIFLFPREGSRPIPQLTELLEEFKFYEVDGDGSFAGLSGAFLVELANIFKALF